MDIEIAKNKIKLCIIGSGEWGSKMINAANFFSRFERVEVINSSTEPEEKERILKESDMIYIAIPPEYQLEYVNYCIDNDKYTICEAPFLENQEERISIFHKLREKKPRLFYINSGYYMDVDFAKIVAKGVSEASNYISITCCGPKHKDNIKKAIKFYTNQSIFLLTQIAFAMGAQKFDKFIFENETTGHFAFRNSILKFSYEYSENPKCIIKIHQKDSVQENILIYDEYDHAFPILKFATDQFYKIVPPHLYSQANNMAEIYQAMNTQSYLLACSAEYFSDQFVSFEGKDSKEFIFEDPLKLFFTGGF